jgi:hypothetical protein
MSPPGPLWGALRLSGAETLNSAAFECDAVCREKAKDILPAGNSLVWAGLSRPKNSVEHVIWFEEISHY